MRIGDFRVWRSTTVCWGLFALFVVLTIIWQLIDVKPYANMHRDWLIGTIVFSCASAVSFIFARRARKWSNKK
jgi:hypothetical protein